MFSAIFWVVLILQNSLSKAIIDLPPFLGLGSHVSLASRECRDDKKLNRSRNGWECFHAA